MRSQIVCGLIAAASLVGGGLAGPCRPSNSVELSTSTTQASQSSTSEPSSSVTLETTSSTTSDHASTSTSITLSTTDEASSSTASSSTELAASSTTSASSSWTSTAESSTSSLASATETATSTAEGTTSTTELTSTTEPSSSTTEASTTTTEAPPPIVTFALQAANSARQDINDKKARYRRSSSGYGIYLTVAGAAESVFGIGDFHIEASTSRLMVGDFYVSVGQTPLSLLVSLSAASVSAVNYRYISCTPPVSLGQKLECVVEGTSRSQLYVSTTPQLSTPMYMSQPGNPPGNAYVTFDLIAVSP